MKPPDPRPIEGKHILAVKKTALRNIVGNDPMILSRIEDAVYRKHVIVQHTTHFMKLYLLSLFEKGAVLPMIDVDFIAISMRVVSNMPPEENRRGRPPNASTRALMNQLECFYKEHYEPLLGKNPEEMRTTLYRIGDMLQYEEKDILKNIKNNIFLHFTDYVKEFINKEFNLKETLSKIDTMALTEEEKRITKRNISIELRHVKNDLISPLGTVLTSPVKYHEWICQHKSKLIPKEKYLKNNIEYDVKAKPMDYLSSMFYVCSQLEKYGRHVHAFPLCTSSIPSYATIDTTTLIMLMIDENALMFRKMVKESKEDVWGSFFQLGNKAFRRKDYRFHYMIKTDGVGASILFHRKDQNPDKLDDDNTIGTVKEKYIDEVEVPQDKNIIGIDVGLDDILYCTDGTSFYRYSVNQRRVQTKTKKYMNIMDSLKKEHLVEDMSVKEWETILSLYNKYTCSFSKFKEYVAQKTTITYTLTPFYTNPLLRKLKWNCYINRQRSEAKMLNKLKEQFGEPDKAIVAIGDWDQGSYHMKGKEPTKGKGMRKVLRQGGYDVYLVDEFKTSCTCHNCHGECKKWLYRPSHKQRNLGENTLVHGLLRCTSVNGCGSLWNRDVNGCLNICMLAHTAVQKEERPFSFRRGIHTC